MKGQINQFMPFGMFATFLLTVALSPKPALYFNPSEINLLFGGPFTRRALVLYKLSSYAFGALLSSLLITLLLPKTAYAPLTSFLGALLTLIFIQLLTVATGLSSQLLARRLHFQRGPSLCFLVLIAALSAYYIVVSDSLTGALGQFQSSLGGQMLLAPFAVFAHIVQGHSSFSAVFDWAALGLALDAALVYVIIELDRRSFELSADASLRLHERWDRARRSGLLWSAQTDVVHRYMKSPRLGGVGPLAWRQMLSALRTSRKIVLVLLAISILAGPIFITVRAEISVWSMLGGVFFAAVFVLPRTLVFDFRSDLEAIETFKSMPLSALKIVVGQLAVPVLLASLIETVFLAGVALAQKPASTVVLFGTGVCLLPFNTLLFGLENLFFMLLPAPLVPVGRADFDFLGRTLIEFVIKSTILIASFVLAVSFGLKMMSATGLPWPALVVTAFVTLVLIAIIVLLMLCWAFNRFDISRQA